MKKSISRRAFVKNTAFSGAGLAVMPFSIIKSRSNSKIRIGVIGVGGRGTSHVSGLLKRPDVEIPAICDIRKEFAERAKDIIVKSGQAAPELYTVNDGDIYVQRPTQSNYALPIPIENDDAKNVYKSMVTRDDLDAVIIATPWRFHVPIAVAAMEAGKYVGVEVPAAYTIAGCWELVNASEKTGMPCMILENVCYRRDVMAILNMVRQGLFGEMIHARCGYQHNLLPVLLDKQGNFGPGTEGESVWRTYHHIKRNGDLYPTHGIGPVAEWMNINRGNRFVKLTSTATKARGLHKTIVERAGKNSPNAAIQFRKGDVVTSTITTSNGETIIATNNTTLPRPYCLGFRCQGTNGLWHVFDTNFNTGRKGPGGMYWEPNKSLYLKGKSPHMDQWESFNPYREKYDAPLYIKYAKQSAHAGHGGMDWYVRNAFVQAVKHKTNTPIDVYDAAAWSVIGPLSEESIARGGAPVEFPDFTHGRWLHNEQIFNIAAQYE